MRQYLSRVEVWKAQHGLVFASFSSLVPIPSLPLPIKLITLLDFLHSPQHLWKFTYSLLAGSLFIVPWVCPVQYGSHQPHGL